MNTQGYFLGLRLFASAILVQAFLLAIPASPAHAQPAQNRSQARSADDLGGWTDALRRQIGRSLFDGMKSVLDSSEFILQQFTDSQVVFSEDLLRRIPDDLPSIERRSDYTIVLSACPQSNSPSSRIVAVSLEMKLGANEASAAPELLRRLVEAAHRRGTTPITVRPPRPNETGVVLEWNDQNRRGELLGYFRPDSRTGGTEAALTSVRWSFRDESLCR